MSLGAAARPAVGNANKTKPYGAALPALLTVRVGSAAA
jgi:hypothetical protein